MKCSYQIVIGLYLLDLRSGAIETTLIFYSKRSGFTINNLLNVLYLYY